VRKINEKVQRKCLTKPTGSENLRRAIDEYWGGLRGRENEDEKRSDKKY
jgi:hypothetical protein